MGCHDFVHGSQRMKPTDFSDPLTFLQAPSSAQNLVSFMTNFLQKQGTFSAALAILYVKG